MVTENDRNFHKMYPLGSLIAELETARRRLLNVFELPVSTATSGTRTYGMRNGLESMGHLTRIKSSMDVPWIDHGCDCTKSIGIGRPPRGQRKPRIVATSKSSGHFK